jgi:hypothetical protein
MKERQFSKAAVSVLEERPVGVVPVVAVRRSYSLRLLFLQRGVKACVVLLPNLLDGAPVATSAPSG